MTAIDEPFDAGFDEPATDDAALPPDAGTRTPQEERRRRRRVLLLLILLLLAVFLVAIVIWYLLFRQPLTDILPPPVVTNPPAYQTALYGLEKPLDVAVLADGSRIIVTQGGGDRSTVMLDATGNKLATLAPPTNVTPMATQFYVAINPINGEIFATDRANGAVFRYAADGTYLGKFEPTPSMPGWQPLGIAFDARGDLFVTDVGGASQRVHMFGPSGILVRDFGVDAGFNLPNGIAVDAAGNVYVADSNNGRLVAFNADGALLGVVARGPSVGSLGMPRGVAVDAKQRVYVVDKVGHEVHMFRAIQAGDPAPVYLTSFGTEGRADGAFEFPNGIAIDGRGRVYVADWNNNRIQIWSY